MRPGGLAELLGCFVAVIVAAALLVAAGTGAPRFRTDPFQMPDSADAPGAVELTDTTIICHQAARLRRHWTSAQHARLLARAGLSSGTGFQDDDIVPVELGGRNADSLNHWIEPIGEAYRKDSVENWAHREVCAGRLALGLSQQLMALHWPALYALMHAS